MILHCFIGRGPETHTHLIADMSLRSRPVSYISAVRRRCSPPKGVKKASVVFEVDREDVLVSLSPLLCLFRNLSTLPMPALTRAPAHSRLASRTSEGEGRGAEAGGCEARAAGRRIDAAAHTRR